MDLATGMEAELWRRIRAGNDACAVEQLITHYVGWASAIARSIHRRVPAYAVDCDDFIQNARIGLLEAVSRFDPERGIPFPAFAKPRIRGAVFNGLRAIVGERPLSGTREIYEDRLSVLMAERADDSTDRVIEAILGLGTAFMLDDHESDDNPAVYAARVSVQHFVRVEVARLPERQRMIIEQHYFHHVPFVDIASRLGLTKGRISQLHNCALKELRIGLHDVP